MSKNKLEFATFDELRQFVYEELCRLSEFEPGVFPMTERTLVRSGQVCGMSFCLHGPRMVKTTAIWETDHHRVFFYDAIGERLHKFSLVHSPLLPKAAA